MAALKYFYHKYLFIPYNDNELRLHEPINIKGDSMANPRGNSKGLVFTAFGAGFLLSLCFPDKFMLFVMALMLVILGIISCQKR